MRSLTIFLCAVFVLLCVSQAQAEVPKLMNYQGKLTTPQGTPLDTTVSMHFSIYPDSTGRDPLWTETQPSVRVDKGIFNTLLGSVIEIPDSAFSGAIRYLGVNVGDDPEIMPRKPIVSVGYAYNSEMLNGRYAGNADGNIPVNNGDLNVNLNANYLDGFDAQTLISPVKQVIRDTMWLGNGIPRTKDFAPLINPGKAVVLLGQVWGQGASCYVLELTSSSITIWSPWGSCCFVVDYQIIEYK